MEGLRLRRETLFSIGTFLGLVGSGFVGPVCGFVSRHMPYGAATIARYDLVLSPTQSTVAAWLPGLALGVGLCGACVVLISGLCSGLRGSARTGLTGLGIALLALNLMWARWLLVGG